MVSNQYTNILRYLQFSDAYVPTNKSSCLHDLLNKIQKILFYYIPDVNPSLDNPLLLFKGKLSFKIFIHKKWAQFGIVFFYQMHLQPRPKVTGHKQIFNIITIFLI